MLFLPEDDICPECCHDLLWDVRAKVGAHLYQNAQERSRTRVCLAFIFQFAHRGYAFINSLREVPLKLNKLDTYLTSHIVRVMESSILYCTVCRTPGDPNAIATWRPIFEGMEPSHDDHQEHCIRRMEALLRELNQQPLEVLQVPDTIPWFFKMHRTYHVDGEQASK